MKMLILTSAQVTEVAGLSESGHALEPRELVNGDYVLPRGVLLDPAHAAKHDFLATLPIRDVAITEFPPAA